MNNYMMGGANCHCGNVLNTSELMAGGGSCSSCIQDLNSNTFRDHIEHLENQLTGGGYSVNRVGENIANRARIDPYTDTNPPVTDLKGNLMMMPGDRSYCGQYGGENNIVVDEIQELPVKRKSRKSRKSKKSRKSRKSKKSRKSRKSKK